MDSALTSPNWDRLFATAVAQEGHFTSAQAAAAGYSPQLLTHHLKARRFIRVRRGIYRLVHFPAGEHEDLVALYLWAEEDGVFSHQTALALHDLSDVLPSQVHITLPDASRKRRLRVSEGVVLHFADIPPPERSWFGPVPATAPLRTLIDCVTSDLPPELLRGAALDALNRGLVTRTELAPVARALHPFGGLKP